MKMDDWVLRQIRAMVLTDLKSFIPEGYFEGRIDFEWLADLKNADFYKEQFSWGYKALELRTLALNPPTNMTPRQVSAADVLMNMGLSNLLEARIGACKQWTEQCMAEGEPDCVSDAVREQNKDQLASAERDLSAALKGYSHYLNDQESKVLQSLWVVEPSALTTSSSQEKYIPKAARQEQAIIETLEKKGYTPIKLPKRIHGKSGVKSEVRDILLKDRPDLFTESSFVKAWERLSADKRIKEAP